MHWRRQKFSNRMQMPEVRDLLFDETLGPLDDEESSVVPDSEPERRAGLQC